MIRAWPPRFSVKEGKPALADELLARLNRSKEEVLLTPDSEKRYVKSILCEQRADRDRLCRSSIQGGGGRNVQASQSKADLRHLKYRDACLEPGFHERLRTEVHRLRSAMEE